MSIRHEGKMTDKAKVCKIKLRFYQMSRKDEGKMNVQVTASASVCVARLAVKTPVKYIHHPSVAASVLHDFHQ